MKNRKKSIKIQRNEERKQFRHPQGTAVFSFARQSSGDEADSASIADQLEANRRTAAALGMTIDWEDWDANITGYSYPDTEFFRACYRLDLALQQYFTTHAATNRQPVFREGLGFIFQQMRKGDVLLLDTATRLVRATVIPTNESNIWNWLEAMEVKTYVGGKLYNPRDIGVKIISAVETQSKEEKAKNAVRGLVSARNKGVMIGFHRLYGYIFSKVHGRQVLSPERHEFHVVRKLFQDFLSGKGKNEICRAAGRGRYAFPCSPQRLNMILNNPKYCGHVYNSCGELIPCPAVEKPVLSLAEWEKVQAMQQKYRPRKEKAEGRKYLLAGLVRCGYCGSIMKPQANRKGRADKYYICQRHASCIEATPCRGSALIDSNEKQAGFENLISPFGMLYFLKDGAGFERMKLESLLKERREELEKVSHVLLSMQKTLETDFMLFETLKLSLEKAGRRKNLLLSEIRMFEDDLRNLNDQDVAEPVRTFREWQKLDMPRRQRIMQEIFRQIRIFQDYYELELYNREVITIPKTLKGKRFFNPEVCRTEFNNRQSQLFILLKGHDAAGGVSSFLYKDNRLEVRYVY